MKILCNTKKSIVSVEDCLKCAEGEHSCQFTYGILKTMFDNELGNLYRVTNLVNKCPRQAILERKLEYAVEPENLWPAFRGTSLHALVEKNKQKNAIVLKLKYKFDGIEITGTIDEYETNTKILRDYKTTENIPTFGPYSHHKDQVNIYAYLIKKQYKLPVNKLEITYFNFNGSQRYIFAPQPDEVTENFLHAKILQFKQAENDLFESYATHDWRCKYCPTRIKNFCYSIDIAKMLKLNNLDVENLNIKQLTKKIFDQSGFKEIF
ncbi:MAG: CRISPR-associated protein Cas4 [Thermoplasmata archaeon]